MQNKNKYGLLTLDATITWAESRRHKSCFCDLDESVRHTVKLANVIRMNVMGKGNMKIEINGMSHIISKVYYIHGLKSNLLSVGIYKKGVTP